MPDRVVAVCLDTLISIECYDDTTDEMIYKLAREKLRKLLIDQFFYCYRAAVRQAEGQLISTQPLL